MKLCVAEWRSRNSGVRWGLGWRFRVERVRVERTPSCEDASHYRGLADRRKCEYLDKTSPSDEGCTLKDSSPPRTSLDRLKLLLAFLLKTTSLSTHRRLCCWICSKLSKWAINIGIQPPPPPHSSLRKVGLSKLSCTKIVWNKWDWVLFANDFPPELEVRQWSRQKTKYTNYQDSINDNTHVFDRKTRKTKYQSILSNFCVKKSCSSPFSLRKRKKERKKERKTDRKTETGWPDKICIIHSNPTPPW